MAFPLARLRSHRLDGAVAREFLLKTPGQTKVMQMQRTLTAVTVQILLFFSIIGRSNCHLKSNQYIVHCKVILRGKGCPGAQLNRDRELSTAPVQPSQQDMFDLAHYWMDPQFTTCTIFPWRNLFQENLFCVGITRKNKIPCRSNMTFYWRVQEEKELVQTEWVNGFLFSNLLLAWGMTRGALWLFLITIRQPRHRSGGTSLNQMGDQNEYQVV